MQYIGEVPTVLNFCEAISTREIEVQFENDRITECKDRERKLTSNNNIGLPKNRLVDGKFFSPIRVFAKIRGKRLHPAST